MARITINLLAPYVLTLATAFFVFAASHGSTAQAQVPGSCATPVAERIIEVGCYVDANEPLGTLPTEPIFWHIYNFPTRAAADSAKPLHGTVIESFGKPAVCDSHFGLASKVWRACGCNRSTGGLARQALHRSLYGSDVHAWDGRPRARTLGARGILRGIRYSVP